MRFTPILFFSCWLFSLPSDAQDMSVPRLLKLSKAYYDSLLAFSTVVHVKNSTSIVLDTSAWSIQCFIDRKNGNKFFSNGGGKGYLVSGEKEYDLFGQSGPFKAVKESQKKDYVYQGRYRHYPFVDPQLFFAGEDLRAYDLIATDSTYVLAKTGDSLEFRRADFSVKRIVKIKYDHKNKGSFFDEVRFETCVEATASDLQRIAEAIGIVNNKENAMVKAPETTRPKTFDLSLLKPGDAGLLNADSISFANKTLFIDFFFQGCYPCVQAYPHVKKLHQAQRDDFMVIGVDTKLSDTLYAKEYLQKYGIDYPVIVGATAYKIGEMLSINSWPTFMVINPNGSIEIFEEGFTPAFFRRIQKKYLSK
ncbi:MAG TPA: TlpA disulfide reductase family protein [Flavisolibacter sp.]|nr:TlpA disulfide reductase family protein [Flavisolibacter sp.]